MQVAGARGGQAVIQTYAPEHYAIRAAAKHDYAAFYRQERLFRRQLAYPPFAHLARLLYSEPGHHTQSNARRSSLQQN